MGVSVKWIIPTLFVASCFAQQAKQELSARDLFYREQAPDQQSSSEKTQAASTNQNPTQTTAQSTPPSSQATHHKSTSTAHKTPTTGTSGTTNSTPDTPSASIQLAAEKEPISAAQALGLRYNVVLVNTSTRDTAPADPDQVFQPGECIALEFEANSSGYLYVLEKGSSGAWTPLLPSAEMPDESNVLKARTVVRIPQNHCFEISGPPGEEQIFVALSRSSEDLNELHQSIKSSAGGEEKSELLAQNNLSDEMTRLHSALQDRDLKVKKIDRPESAGEPANSVYIVNASLTSSNRVVAEIRIQHR